MPLSKAAAAQSPDARPTVSVEPTTWASGDPAWLVVCRTGTCDHTYGPALKTDAEEAARRHRHNHRRKAEYAQHPAPTCSKCGCTDDNACFLGCYWVHKPGETPLCSTCALEPESRVL